jgi:hypothetical protein
MKGTWIALAVALVGVGLVGLGVGGVAAPAPEGGIDTPAPGNSPLIWIGIVVAVCGLGLFGVLRAWARLDHD